MPGRRPTAWSLHPRAALAGVSATALAAGLLYGAVAPAASAEEAASADGVVAGVETVGPIATVQGASGELWPGIPPQVAVLPNGSILEGDFPLIYSKALKEFDSLPYRVIDLATRDARVVADGTMRQGWAEVRERLKAGGLYQVDVEAEGEWISAGRFSVGVRGTTAGPGIDVAGLTVSTVTGSVSSGWASRVLPSPSSSVAVGLAWRSGGGAPAPGLPTGWLLSASTGSAWAALRESGAAVEAVDVPRAPAAQRARGASRATVSFAYPAKELAEVRRILVATKVRGATWKIVKRTDVDFAEPAVNERIRVPAQGRVQVKVGLDVGQTVVWSAPSRVTAKAVAPPVAASAGSLRTAGRESDVTAGELPDVVTLVGWDTSQLDFVRNPLGVYEQMGGTAGFRNSLTSVSKGVWEFTDTQGVATRFRDGRAVSVVAPQGPLATLTWDAQGRLTAVTNDVGGTIRLEYQGAGTCPDWSAYGFAAAPTGKLCAIAYPGGLRSEIGYVTAGSEAQIALIKDPGNDGSIWGWDSRGRIVSTRSTLVTQVATIEPGAAAAISTLTYDSLGRAGRLTEAPATIGGASLARIIDFPSITSAAVRAWVEDPSLDNAARGRVTTEGAGGYSIYQEGWFDLQTLAPVRVRDSAGLETSRPADVNDGRVRSSKDASDRITRFTYNDLGLVTRTEGPVSSGSGAVQERKYDTEYVNGEDKPLTGLRVLTYERAQFGGKATAEFWRSSYNRSALSVEWSGRSDDFSAQATGVWVPADADDRSGARDGWQFAVTASGGTTATLLVGTTPCEGDPCVIRDLPTGAKSVTLQISQAGASGWVDVVAAPVGKSLTDIADTDVSPGYALNTVASNNDVASGMRSENTTRYAFPNPADGRPSRVEGAGGLDLDFAYEPGPNGRLVSSTMPSGKQVTTSYWGVGERATLPAVCGGESLAQIGQGKTVTRQDGTTVTQYHDEWGFLRSAVVAGTGISETGCYAYNAAGDLVTQSYFDREGRLIESTEVTYAVGGDPRVTSQTITHGPAAPVSPGTSVTSSSTVDLGGRTISSTDASGVVTRTEYDSGGLVSRVTHTPPPASGGAPLVFTYTYRSTDGAMETVRVNGVLAATLNYDPATSALTSVEYADGVTRSVTRLANGTPGTVTVVTPDARFTRITDERATSDYGRTLSSELTVVGSQERTEARGYTYDAAGRLERARINGTGGYASADYTYAFDASQAPACGSAYPGAGLDSLRTGGSRGGVDYRTCYDAQGRPVSTTDPLIVPSGSTSEITYDGFGRVTNVSGPRAAALQWGSGTTLTRVDEIAADGTGLVRTVLNTYGGAIHDKTVIDDSGTSTLRYAGSFLLDVDNGDVTGVDSVIYGLPGAAHVRTAPGSTATLTIAGLDGSALVTVEVPSLGSGSAAVPGSTTGLADRYGPFGEPLVTPDAAGDARPTFAWQAAAGQETLPGTSSITLMGARPYLPSLGAFLAPDPVLESGHNLYAYTNGDPVNAWDTSGNMTEDTWSDIFLYTGITLAVLGGLSFGVGRAKLLNNKVTAEAAKFFFSTAPGNVWRGLGIAAGVGGAALVGGGTYLKIKSSLSDTQSILASVGAAIGSVAVSYLAAMGSMGVAWRMHYKQKPLNQRSAWSLGFAKAKPGAALQPRKAVASGESSGSLASWENLPDDQVRMADILRSDAPNVAPVPMQVPQSRPAPVVRQAPLQQAPVVHQQAIQPPTVVRQSTVKTSIDISDNESIKSFTASEKKRMYDFIMGGR